MQSKKAKVLESTFIEKFCSRLKHIKKLRKKIEKILITH